jgi:hypothetical protein
MTRYIAFLFLEKNRNKRGEREGVKETEKEGDRKRGR